MSLPLDYVEAIFTKLSLVYGRSFLDRWAGIDMERVKADWGHELAGLERSPKSIAHALQNLPADKPPTVLEFRKIAWSMPAADMPAIEHTPASKKVIAAVLGGFTRDDTNKPDDGRNWARRIMSRVNDGEKLKIYSVNCAKKALRLA